LYYESFDYDKNGNKVYIDKNGEVTRYKYDGMNRLTRAWNDNTYTEYEFDNFNNISKEYELYGNSIETKSYFYDNANHLLLQDGKETVQYEYDNAGNLVKKITGIGSNAETAYYSYDGYNRLSGYADSDTVSEYAYNLDGLRESKTVNNIKTRYVYDGANILGEITEENIYTYTRGTELIGYTSNSGDRLYYVQDGHGNVTALLNEDGTERKTYTYNPYGKEEEQILYPMGSKTAIMLWRLQTETPHNPFRYCGEYYDDETDLIYLRNRYYDNTTGRFITEDPVKDSINWYAYCGNNPVMFTDVTGNIREPGYVNGVFVEDPDAYEFGEDSLIYSSLTTLGQMWKARPDNREDIAELANMVRKIGRQNSISIKLSIAIKKAPASANATDIVLLAGDIDKAYFASNDMKTAQKYADKLYGKDSDGSQHNALKHTMWNALMTKRYGKAYAKLMANSHEFGARENLNLDEYQQSLMNMDLWNNAKGREIGRIFQKSHWYGNYDKELANEIVKNINDGTLWVVNWVD
jgi:RHS repeat-associated protein